MHVQVWFYTFLCTLVLCIFPSTRTLALTVMVVLLSGALVPFQSFQADLKWRKGRMMHDMAGGEAGVNRGERRADHVYKGVADGRGLCVGYT